MTRIAVLSLKGGTGKTTVTLGLAGAAAARGRTVLVVDLDPQANATAALGIDDPPFTVSDALADGRRGIAADALMPSTWPVAAGVHRVLVLPSERSLEHRSSTAPGSSARLSRVLHKITGSETLTLIDCPPTLGELTRNALVAADAALIVTDPSYFALTGAAQAVEALDIVRTSTNPRLVAAGIVVNRVRSRSAEQVFRLAELREAYPDLLLDPVLTERVSVPASQGAGVPIQAWAGAGAREISRDFDLLLSAIDSRLTATRTQPAGGFA
ncbi:MAG: ParA family protein [Actinomycetes bacterium]